MDVTAGKHTPGAGAASRLRHTRLPAPGIR